MTDRTFNLTVDADGTVVRVVDVTPTEASDARPIATDDVVRVGADPTFQLFGGASRSRAPEGFVSRVHRLDEDGDAVLDGGYVVSPRHLTPVEPEPEAAPEPTDPDLFVDALPTEPGLYVDKQGDVWDRRYDDRFDVVGYKSGRQSAQEGLFKPADYLPFRRIRPAQASS